MRLKKFLYWSIVSSLAAAVILSLGSTAFWFLDPVGFRLTVFQPVREFVFFVRELDALTDFREINTIAIPAPAVVDVPQNHINQITIVADLWVPTASGLRPAMILLHGSAPWGRQAGLIQLLGHRLHQRGWIVLAPDARGFGDTDDPKDIDDPDAWKVAADVQRAINYITNIDNVDLKRIYVFGHSLGANYALEGALDDPRVCALILVGPSRHLGGSESRFGLWNRTRFAADRRLDQPISLEVMKSEGPRSDIALLARGPLSRPGHKPILLIDGMKEGQENLNFLRDLVNKISPPVNYYTLQKSGHYSGVINLYGGDIVYYRSDMFEEFVGIIIDYVGEVRGICQ